MIEYNRFELDNGLRVIHHFDGNTPFAVINILYNVGARDEDPDKTGFAHLFEHLMFGGSENIPEYDSPLQMAGGENNAFTSNDITNYYITLPADNIETGFWLESDRMLGLSFSQKSLDVQKGVVIEEFKQRYLNQPYGDVWLNLRSLAYKHHPYRWPTIGKEISHIENASLEDVKSFFYKFYNPNNAILAVTGNISFEKVKELSVKWFSDIPKGLRNENIYTEEPKQTEKRILNLEAGVPQDAIYMAFLTAKRNVKEYYAADLLSDILTRSESSRFYNSLVRDKKLFSQIDAYISGDMDAGLFVIQGRLNKDVTFERAEAAIMEEIESISTVNAHELDKVKNKSLTANLFSRTSSLNKAMNLCYAENLGDIDLINTEIQKYYEINPEDIKSVALELF
ncbi:MAG: insulinase family protein, partial [Bacteroidia bacterium]|nr:insulinase family protein [Bacteroidia bacterium]